MLPFHSRVLGCVVAFVSACGGDSPLGGGGGGTPFDGNSVTGEVDGVSVTAGTAHLVHRLNNDDDTILVVLTAASCEEHAEMYAALESSEDVAALVDQWNATFPDEWWKLYMRFDVADVNTSLDGVVRPGRVRGESVDNDVSGRFMHYRQALDADYFESGTDRDDYYVRWTSEGGSFIVDSHTPGESLRGSFETSVIDASEPNVVVGNLVIEFNAQRCPELDEYLGALGYL